MATHNLHPNIVLAYHGCDESVGRALLEGEAFRKSKNDYDWLGGGRDLLLKRLDCAVIMALHEMLEEAGLPPADSLRGLYYEGDRLYDESSFYEKSHVQTCIRNPDCIKGVFLPKAGP